MIELSLANATPVSADDMPAVPGEGELHLWRWTIDDLQDRWLEQLDANERARHQRLATPDLRQRFLASHGGQRQLLAGYLGCEPGDVVFNDEPKGKPFLPGRPFEFNLSHSGDESVLVIGKQPVGVDVERHRSVSNLRRLAGKHFTDNEQMDVIALDDDGALGYFLQIWTRKEAAVKVTGLGLGASVRMLELIAVTSDFCKFELPSQWNTDLEVCWLADLTMSTNSYGAVATAFEPSVVRCFAWAESPR